MATVLTGRMCPWKCSFCYPVEVRHYGQMRRRSVDSVLAELNWLERLHGPLGGVVFHDSEFFMHKKWLEEFLERYRRETKGWPFWAATRADMVCRWPELFEALVLEGNWRAVSIGFESGSDRVLGLLNKGTTRAQNDEAIRRVNALGDRQEQSGQRAVEMYANIMLGIPGEQPEEALETVRMAMQVKRALPSMAFFTPYRGNVLGEQMWSAGRVLSTGDNYYGFQAKVAGVDYEFYRRLLAGAYNDVLGGEIERLMLDAAYTGVGD